jgi:hypothetical protein
MLSSDTLIRTTNGWAPWPKEKGEWLSKEPPIRYTFVLARGTSPKTWTVVASRPHKWPLRGNIEYTYDLRIGDVVPAVDSDSGHSPIAWVHGFVKRHSYSGGLFCLVDVLKRYQNKIKEFSIETDRQDDHTNFKLRDYPWSFWPFDLDKSYSVDVKYISSFLLGYIAGSEKETGQLQTTDFTAAEWLYTSLPFAGYIASGTISDKMVVRQTARVNAPNFHKVYSIQCVQGKHHGGFRCLAQTPLDSRLGVPLVKEQNPSYDHPICFYGGIKGYL